MFTVKSCPPLTAPDNGKIDCSLGNDGLPTPQDKCTASCNSGFVLSGTTTRRCKADETWTGSDAVCTAGKYRVNMHHILITGGGHMVVRESRRCKTNTREIFKYILSINEVLLDCCIL